MSLAIFNGSPRNKKSNSKTLIEHFIAGYSSVSGDSAYVGYLADKSNWPLHIKTFSETDTVIVVFPLYADSMPGIVKEFFEEIFRLKLRPRNLGFIVQSGFPESHHSVYLEHYLKKFAQRVQSNYLGTVIKGGVEGIQIMPPMMTKNLFANFHELGREFASTGKFSEKIMKKFMKPYRMSALRLFIFRIMSITGLANYYWDSNLKKNGVFKLRFDKPY